MFVRNLVAVAAVSVAVAVPASAADLSAQYYSGTQGGTECRTTGPFVPATTTAQVQPAVVVKPCPDGYTFRATDLWVDSTGTRGLALGTTSDMNHNPNCLWAKWLNPITLEVSPALGALRWGWDAKGKFDRIPASKVSTKIDQIIAIETVEGACPYSTRSGAQVVMNQFEFEQYLSNMEGKGYGWPVPQGMSR